MNAHHLQIALFRQSAKRIPYYLDESTLSGDGAASVRHHVDGHIYRHDRALDAADGRVDDHHAAALADVIRRINPAGKHTHTVAAHYAGGADHPFRITRPGHSLPRCAFEYRLAKVSCPDRDRQRLFYACAEPLPQDHQLDDLIRRQTCL